MQPDTPKTPEEWASELIDMGCPCCGTVDTDEYKGVFRAAMEQAWQEGYRACRHDDAVEERFQDSHPDGLIVYFASVTKNPYRTLPSPNEQPQ